MSRSLAPPARHRRPSDSELVVAREGLARLFPADCSEGFEDLLRAIDVADARLAKGPR